MIGNHTLDENEKPKRTRAVRRRNDYLKAKKFKEDMIDIGWECEEIPLGRFTKNTSFNYILQLILLMLLSYHQSYLMK